MMKSVTAEINISKPSRRRIIRDLEKQSKVVYINYPLPNDVSGTGYSLEESYQIGLNKLSAHYGTDFNKL